MKWIFLAMTVFLASCSEPVDIAFLNYQDCRKQMTQAFIDQGIHPVAANMKAKAYCEEQMSR
ncbi:MAG: hypothetical protein PVI97_15085 [Candidatus Thiodiazotropha sp.]|jgi:hypothetical protein